MMSILVRKIALSFLVVLSGTLLAQAQTVAFVNVNVVPMDKERVLAGQTVLVRNGMIEKIGDVKKVKVPGDAQKIDGTGKYLIPGLTDMHVHMMSDDGFPRELAGDELKIMIANGVTTIRIMNGMPEHLVMRAQSAKGEIIAPALYVASPQFIGKQSEHSYIVTTPEEGRASVRKAREGGYDFLKMVTDLKPDVYEAIVDEAKKVGMRVIGHADSRSIGLERALKAGQQVEHLDAYLEALLKSDAPMKGSVSDIYLYNAKNWESLDYMDEAKIPVLAAATVKSNPFSDPTLSVFKSTFGTFRTEESIRAQPDFRFYPEKTRAFWLRNNQRIQSRNVPAERRAKYVDLRNRLVKAIYDAGGKIMAGSDTPEFLFLYGFSLHREIKAIRDAGLSNFAALQAATVNPALFFQAADKTGTVEKGKQADLVLLNANPLDDISNTEKRAGVMRMGKWYTQDEMNKWLDEIAPRFAAVEMKE
jgi:imidazolonepropionase-like amidohydrolase